MMPVFRINIAFANGKHIKGYHLVDDVELDTYYRHLFRFAQRAHIPITSFDVVQVSELSREATYMRQNNHKRMTNTFQNAQPRHRPIKRRRPL